MATSKSDEPPVYVTASALNAGHLTLPEHLFVTDAEPDKRNTVPSLSFLIRHPSTSSGAGDHSVTNIVFDLGLKRDLTGYAPAQQPHITQRQPIITDPDCAASLRNGGLDPAKDIGMVILSHVHWDHVGTPSDFSGATFAVGSGTLHLLEHGAGPLYPADWFNTDELPRDRTVEFPPVPRDESTKEYDHSTNTPKHTRTPGNTASTLSLPAAAQSWKWESLADGGFPQALDLFGDRSVYVIDSPGHLYGHVNLLVRLGERRYAYLGGDCCHDSRILSGEKGIGMYDDGRGGMRSVHVHTETARRTVDQISDFVRKRKLHGEDIEVEIVLAHDAVWREKNKDRFLPGKL